MLKEGTDFTVKYEKNRSAGTALVTVTGTGNYTGSAELSFVILPLDVTADGIMTPEFASAVYTGENIRPKVTITAGGKEITDSYALEYANVRDAPPLSAAHTISLMRKPTLILRMSFSFFLSPLLRGRGWGWVFTQSLQHSRRSSSS